jgi:mono/diheme cytochrome c family protein
MPTTRLTTVYAISLGLLTTGPAALADGVSPSEARETVTFTEHVAPIVFQNCSSCHRPGAGTPFSLLSFQDVKKRGRLIQNVTQNGYMPPWPPAQGWGHFKDERRLSESQLDTLDRWVEAGMPEGPKDKLPPLPKFPEGGWQLGKPDLVVTLPEVFDVPAGGRDIYRMFVLPLNLPKDQWVTAVEIRPTAPSVVHHALYFLDSTGAARKLDDAEPGLGFSRMGFPRTGSLGGWAVGATPRHLPMGLAYPLSKSSDLVVQMHFHPSGKAERERTSFGLYFAKQAPKKKLLGTQAPMMFGRGTELGSKGIKPGDKDFTIHGQWEVPFDIDLVTAGGHAHYLCNTMKAVALLPNGKELKLFAIDDWDFNWQGRYNYTEPIRLPKGALIRTTLTYDNSAANPRNPSNPPVHVRWGEGSTDEMGSIGFAFIAVNDAELASYRGPSIFAGGDQAARLGGLFGLGGQAGVGAGMNINAAVLRRQLEARDTNKDGKLDGDEIPERLKPFVGFIDTNGDGALDREELQRVFDQMKRRNAGDADEPTTKTTGRPIPEADFAAPSRGPALKDLTNRTWYPLSPAPGTKAQVLVFVTQDCPVANHYASEIGRIAREYADKKVPLLLVHVDSDLTLDAARHHAEEYHLDMPILIDAKHELVARAGAKVTPEAAVITPDGKVVYCGRIDDRFGKLGRQRPEPNQRELRDALDSVLAGTPVAVARVDAIGCPIADLKSVESASSK